MKYVPPWREPYFIGVAGCSGSGKTSITRELVQCLNIPWSVLLSMDNFYNPLDYDQRQLAFRSEFDFDHPSCVDFDLLLDVLHKLKRGEKTDVPIYSFKKHNRTDLVNTIYGANVVILEGIYALYDQRVLDLLDLKIFVHEDFDVCMARRLHRDILYRGRELELSIKQWHKFVKPNYLAYILPTAKSANMLIPKGIENTVAINILFLFVQRQLKQKSQMHLQELRNLGRGNHGSMQNVELLKVTNQVAALQTMILDSSSSRDDFVFAVDRISSRLTSLALDRLWLVEDNADQENGLCAVTMVRGGECFETAIRRIVPTVYMGRLLILSDSHTGEPALHLSKLPPWLSEGSARVILTEAQIISGSAAVMAIAVLVDHGVKQSNIVFTALVASEIGARRILAAFPDVHLIFGKIDAEPQPLSIDARYYGV